MATSPDTAKRSSDQSRAVSYFYMSDSRGLAATPERRAVARVGRSSATAAVGLTEVRRAKAEKVSQSTAKVLVFQVEKLLACQQATLRFHGISILHLSGKFMAKSPVSTR